jgi:hypothetical protein
MKKVNGFRNFSFGDIITFGDDDIVEKFKNKKFKFIEVNGEDYFLYDIKEKDITHVRAYYFKKFVKKSEETKKITTWELSSE